VLLWKPTINGELGYRWNNPNAEPMIHPVNAPTCQREKLYFTTSQDDAEGLTLIPFITVLRSCTAHYSFWFVMELETSA